MTPDDHSPEDQRDSRRLKQLAELPDKKSPEANALIAELIVSWRRFYEPWLVLQADRQIADAVVSSVEWRLIRLLRREQQFDTSWRSVVWATVRWELTSERRRLARRGEHETAVAEVFGEDTGAGNPTTARFDDTEDDPEEDRARLTRARAKLSASDNEVLRLMFDEDLRREEAAKQLGISVGTLSTRQTRALQRLRKAWNEHDGEDV